MLELFCTTKKPCDFLKNKPKFHVFTTTSLTSNGRDPQGQHTFALLETVLFLRFNKSQQL